MPNFVRQHRDLVLHAFWDAQSMQCRQGFVDVVVQSQVVDGVAASRPYSRMKRRLVLINFITTFSDVVLHIFKKNLFTTR